MNKEKIEELQTISLEETRKLLGYSRSAIYELLRKGKLPAARIGKKWLVRVTDLKRILNMEV